MSSSLAGVGGDGSVIVETTGDAMFSRDVTGSDLSALIDEGFLTTATLSLSRFSTVSSFLEVCKKVTSSGWALILATEDASSSPPVKPPTPPSPEGEEANENTRKDEDMSGGGLGVDVADDFVVDVAVALGGGRLRVGGWGSVSTSMKVNRLLEIERETRGEIPFVGKEFRKM